MRRASLQTSLARLATEVKSSHSRRPLFVTYCSGSGFSWAGLLGSGTYEAGNPEVQWRDPEARISNQ